MTGISKIETGKIIRKLMRERGYSVRDIQEAMNLDSPQAVYKWLNGAALPSLENALALGEILELPVEAFLIREDGRCAPSRVLMMKRFQEAPLVEIRISDDAVRNARRLRRQLRQMESKG